MDKVKINFFFLNNFLYRIRRLKNREAIKILKNLNFQSFPTKPRKYFPLRRVFNKSSPSLLSIPVEDNGQSIMHVPPGKKKIYLKYK